MTNDDDVPRKLNGPKVASNIPYKPNRFFWHPYIPEGETCIIAGAGGDGKGLFCCDIVARLTQGREWPLSDEYARIRNVRWFEAEDDVRKTLRPRFKAAKADLDRIAVESEEEFNKLTRKSLQSDGIGLLVLSPLLSFLSVDNFNSETQVRKALRELSAKIDDLRCSVVGIMHPNKKVDLAAIERILGSVAFRNFVRSIILTKSETEDSTRIVHAKWNLSTRGKDLLFTKVNRRAESSPRGQYIGIDWQATDENIDPATAFDRIKLTNDDQSAAQWLRDHLIPSPIDQNRCAHWRNPMDMMRQG